jgi:lysophospholipase L1-like esterase
MRAPRSLPLLLAGLLTIGTVSACQDDPPPPADDGIREYVALGDSYAAAPHLPDDDLSMPCARSADNYPALVADALGPMHLDDVSCVGAMSAHLTKAQVKEPSPVPPQLDALSDDTDLVTLTIGGNDKGLFPSWNGCRQLTHTDPKGSPCADSQGNSLLSRIPQIQANLTANLAEIERRAPNAAVVVVTYPQLFPDRGTCELTSAFARGDQTYINSIVKALSDAMIAAAQEAEVGWVDVYSASRGHDICSDKPWVNGITDDWTRANELHPFPEEQAAVTQLILDRLTT